MKKNIALALVVLLVHEANGQTANKKSGPKYEFGISFTPSVAFRKLGFSKNQEFLETLRNHNETPKFSFNAALLAQRHVGKKGTVELGVSFSNPGYKTKEAPLIWEPSNPEYPAFTHASFSYQYLSLSARFRFVLLDGKMQYYIVPGLSLDALIDRKTTLFISYSDGEKDKSKSAVRGSFSEIGLSLIAAAGVKYNLSNRYAICIEPTFKRGLVSVIPDTDSKEYLYFFGLNMIVIFSIKK
jgi:Outer membrane protein beta-barrel domain